MKTSHRLATSLVLLGCMEVTPVRAQSAEPNLSLPSPPPYGAPGQPSAPLPGYGQPLFVTPGYAQPQSYSQPDPRQPSPYKGLQTFHQQIGIGIRFSGLWAVNDLLIYGQGGIGLDLLFRAHSRVTVEVSAQYEHSGITQSFAASYERIDVPILGGLRVHLGPVGWSVAPYLVAAVGADYAQAAMPTAREAGWFAALQGGAGVEGRMGRHAALTVDLRGFGRLRESSTNARYISNSQGNWVPMLGEQSGFLFNASFAVYF